MFVDVSGMTLVLVQDRSKGTKLNAVLLYKFYVAFWGDFSVFIGPYVDTMSKLADPIK